MQLCFVRRHGGNVGVGPAGVTLQYVVTVRAIHYLNICVFHSLKDVGSLVKCYRSDPTRILKKKGKIIGNVPFCT